MKSMKKEELKELVKETSLTLELHIDLLNDALRLMEENSEDDIYFLKEIRDRQVTLLKKIQG